jgi:hypothetical protein
MQARVRCCSSKHFATSGNKGNQISVNYQKFLFQTAYITSLNIAFAEHKGLLLGINEPIYCSPGENQ